MNQNDNPKDAPPELLAQAYRIALYFAERGISEWVLGPLQKRSEPRMQSAGSKQFEAALPKKRPLSDMLDEDEGITRGKAASPPTHSLSDDFKRDGGRQGD